MEPFISSSTVLRRKAVRTRSSYLRRYGLLAVLLGLGAAYQAQNLTGLFRPAVQPAAAAAPGSPVASEIDEALYDALRADLADVPGLRTPISEALADGTITRGEYDYIRTIKTRADPTPPKTALEHELRVATGAWRAEQVL